jgi:hypothetical protein
MADTISYGPRRAPGWKAIEVADDYRRGREKQHRRRRSAEAAQCCRLKNCTACSCFVAARVEKVPRPPAARSRVDLPWLQRVLT